MDDGAGSRAGRTLPSAGRRPDERTSVLLWTGTAPLPGTAPLSVRGQAPGYGQPQPGYANWSCRWGADPAYSYSPFVRVSIERYFRLTGTPTRIGVRTADVAPSTERGDTSCSVSLVQRRHVDPDGENRVEVLTIEVYSGRQATTDTSCRHTRAVAEAAAPRLPPPS